VSILCRLLAFALLRKKVLWTHQTRAKSQHRKKGMKTACTGLYSPHDAMVARPARA
jgi:hypothetical protein